MKAKLTEFLVCPACQEALTCAAETYDHSLNWTEIMEGSLTCQICAATYPIQRGIPRMLIKKLSLEEEKTVAGFGYEWETFDEQIQDSFMTSAQNFLDFIYPTEPEFFTDRVVLDAGCGMGRFLKLGAEFGSTEIIGIDRSHSVEAAYKNTRTLPNAHVVQADILALPFPPLFDYIFSVGVLQFLPQPQAGFAGLATLLRENGRLSAWVYAAENNGWVTRLITPVRKYVTSRLPKPVLYRLCQLLGGLLFVLLRGIYKPANEGTFGFKFHRILPYNHYLYYTSRLNFNSLVSIIFDHLVPQIVHYVPFAEFQEWFVTAGLQNIVITDRNNMSWRGQGELI